MKRLRYFIGYIAILGLCAAVIGILTAFSPHETEAFGGGNGSESNPWLITNVSELQDVNLDLTAHYKLANDINASETSEWNSGAGFVPIAGGGTANKFNGGFDGDGHTITGLYINRPLTANVGLFGHVGDNTAATVIKEVGLINTSIVGARGTGTLIGRVTGNANTLIEHCSSVNGSVTGDGATGGLIGSHNSWRETPGGTDNPVLRYSWANISVSYSGTGAGDKFGGLVGCSQKGTISNCYARGNVTHSGPGERIGGLAGCIDYRGELFDSYSTGLVTVAANCTKYGGLVGNREGKGNNIGVVTNCFWDTETSNQSSSAGGTGKTTEQMKNESTFANATWNFDDIWTIDAQNDGYPRLIWTDVVVIPILTINGSFTANDKVYDGTNVATGNTSGLALNGSLTRGTNVNLTDVVIVFNNSSVGAGKTVYITSAALNGSDAGNYSLSLVGAPTATANISYMLNTSSTAGGNVTTPGEPGPYYYYTENQSVNIVATPDACYHFVNWTGTGAAAIANTSAASTNITMNASYSVTANFAIDTFTLNTSSTAGGNVSVPGEGTPIGTYNCSEAVTITAANDSCYYFVDWTGDTGNISDVNSANTSISMYGNYSIQANFALYQYNLNYSAGAGGSLTGNTPQTVNCGSNGSAVNAVPDACYYFVNWSDSSTDNPRTDTNVTDNISVIANFAAYQYTLNTSSTAGGNVSAPGEGTPIGTYNCSEAVTITAANDSCYYFVNWSGDTGNISNVNNPNTSISMNGNYSIQANFALYQYNLNYSAGAGGSLTGNTSQTVNCGSNGSAVNAVPDACYYFVNWSDSSTDNPRTDTNVTDNISVIANFAAYQYTLNTSSTAGGNVSAPGEGTPIGTYNCSEAVTINASPDGGYYFVDWTGDTGNISDVNSANTSISMYGNYSIQANFINVMHNLSTGSTAGGNVTAPGEGNYSYGDGHVVNITATPDTCYHFVNWTGDTGNVSDVNSANTSITMYGDYSITANFAISQYTLNYSAGAGGIINGTSLQTVNCSENGSTVEAVPDACYYFVNWSDSSTQNPRTDTHVTDNVSVTANFAIYQYNLNTSSTAGGNVTAPGESGPYNYNCSEVVAITAVNDSCYYFVNWTGSGVNAGMVADPNAASTTINMSNNASVQANFAMTTYDIDVTQADNGVIVPGDVTVNCGSNQSFNITANDCYIISSVIVDGTDYPVDPLEHATNASVHFNGIDAAHNLSAIFIMDSYMINASAGANGNISPPGATVVNCSDSQEYTITPDACYHVVDVEADGSSVGAVTSYIFNDVRADHTINATFAIDQYTLTYIAGSGGTINGTTPQTVNCGENGSAVEAVANTCYVFVRWNDSVLDNPRTDINVSENLTVSAVFGYICGGGGYIPPSPTISINVFDDTSTHPTDGNGVLQQDADAVSPDGKIAIHVPAGTSALDADGNPLTEINVDTIDSYPAPPDDRIVIAAFDFHPDGAIFNPAIQITLTYDPAALPAGADESGLSIAYYNEASNEWECVSGTVNPDTNTITFSITHFTVFVIVASCESAAAPTETPAPTPTVTPTPEATIEPTPTPTVAPTPTISPSPTPTPPASCLCDGKNRWICILLTVTGGILLAGLIGAIIRRKRKR